MDSITGTYQHNIDAKGRLVIPAKLQKLLGDTFYLAMGMDTCLSIYPQESWERFTAKFASLPASKSKGMRILFANAEKCEPDSQGRIVISQRLRSYAALGKNAVIVGVNDRAEIWDADRWKETEDEMTPEKMAELMDSLEL